MREAFLQQQLTLILQAGVRQQSEIGAHVGVRQGTRKTLLPTYAQQTQ
jgi:hypothetical protein